MRLGCASRILGVGYATDNELQAIPRELLDIELTNSFGAEQEMALVVLLHVASYVVERRFKRANSMSNGIAGAIFSCNDVSGDDRPILVDANELGTVGRELSGNQGGWVIMKVAPRVVLHRVEPSAAFPSGDRDQFTGGRVPDIARSDLHRGPRD